MQSLSLVLPCFNEEANIQRTIVESFAWMDKEGIDGEVIVVDDGSIDRSLEILHSLAQAEPRLVVVSYVPNRGYGAALREGFDHARKELCAFMDSDGQFHAEDLGRLLPKLSEVQFVTGIRIKRADAWNRTLNSRLYNWLVRIALGVKVGEINCGMKAFRRSLWPLIRPSHATGALFNAEMFLMMQEQGIAWAEVSVPHFPREAGVPSGAHFPVILRMFRELAALKRSRRLSSPPSPHR